MKKIIVVLTAILLLSVGYVWAEGNPPTMRDIGVMVYGKYMDMRGLQLSNVSNITFSNVSEYNVSIAPPRAHYINLTGNMTGQDLIFMVSDPGGYSNEVMRFRVKVSPGITNGTAIINMTRFINFGNVTIGFNYTNNTLDCFDQRTGVLRYCGNGTIK